MLTVTTGKVSLPHLGVCFLLFEQFCNISFCINTLLFPRPVRSNLLTYDCQGFFAVGMVIYPPATTNSAKIVSWIGISMD